MMRLGDVRRRKYFAFWVLTITFLASAALFAEFYAGYYTDEGTGEIHQIMTSSEKADSTYEVGAFALNQAPLVTGDGRSEVASYCNTCHSPRYITMQPPLPAEQWEAEVNKMMKTYGASIPEDARQKINRYLKMHYTPETRMR